MNSLAEKISIPHQLILSGRIFFATMIVCGVLYTMTILAIGQSVVPHTANGSLLHNDHGEIVGSEMLAQSFDQPKYFWPRPSAVQYNATATGGSNLSPTNPALRERAKKIMDHLGAEKDNPVPADLVTASGSGMDPHITLKAARYQAQRVARERGLSSHSVQALLDRHANRAGGLVTPEPLVNVVLVNGELEKMEH